jgi:hypothetical protein
MPCSSYAPRKISSFKMDFFFLIADSVCMIINVETVMFENTQHNRKNQET